MRKLFAVVALVVLLAPSALAAVGASPQAPTAVVSPDYVFPSGAGALFFHVKPERAQDFEAVVTTLAEVLDRTADPVRHQQAANWRVFKSTEAPRDFVIYVFFFDPAVLGADYDPVKVLGEALPADLQGLYERLKTDIVRVERMGLTKIR